MCCRSVCRSPVHQGDLPSALVDVDESDLNPSQIVCNVENTQLQTLEGSCLVDEPEERAPRLGFRLVEQADVKVAAVEQLYKIIKTVD